MTDRPSAIARVWEVLGIVIVAMITATGCAWVIASIAFGQSKTAEWIVWGVTMPVWLALYASRGRSRDQG